MTFTGTISDLREKVADVINSTCDVNLLPFPRQGVAWKPRDGWINVTRSAPGSTTTGYAITLAVVVILGSDTRRAEESISELSVPLIDAATRGLADADIYAFDVEIDYEGVDVADSTIPALRLVLTTEIW